MDERERGEIRLAITALPSQIRIETLEVADFILSPQVGIERKRGDDFTGSIFDHRLFLQLEKLRASFTTPLLILESPKKMFSRSFWNEKAIYGALVYVAYKMRIPIIPTIDEADTAQVIYQLALLEHRRTPHWDYKEVLGNIAAQAKKPHFLQEDQRYFLQGLVDVGEKKAAKYHEILGNPYYVLQGIMQTTIETNKKGTPKAIAGLMASFKGTGPKLIARNQRLLTTSYKANKKNKDLIRL
jgi:Fanconi anemia group M protein